MTVLASRFVDQLHGLINVERFRQILERATFVRGNRVLEVRMRGYDDDGQVR